MTDYEYMTQALALAREAERMDEVPIGAVLVVDGRVVGRGKNAKERARSATCHAEILAIEEACRNLGGWRLPNATLYVTLEPCPMCAGAVINAHIGRVVFGASDPKGGALGGLTDLSSLPFNHRPQVTRGVLAEECATLLSAYFKRKRAK